MTSEQHNKYIGISFFIYAGFQLFFLLLMMAWFYFILRLPMGPGEPPPPMEFFGFFFAFITIFQLIFTAPTVIAGYAVLTKKKWARIASIVGAVMSGMSVPIGTAVCVYAMWFFLGEQWKEVYDDRSTSTPYTSLGLNPADDWSNVDQEIFRHPEYEPKPGDWR